MVGVRYYRGRVVKVQIVQLGLEMVCSRFLLVHGVCPNSS